MADSYEDKLAELREVVTSAYMVIAAYFEELPLKVELPPFGVDPSVGLLEAIPAMHRARTVVRDEPISLGHQRALRAIALEWLAACDLTCVATTAGATPWRVDAIEIMLMRIGSLAEMIDKGEVDQLEGQDE